MLGGVSHLAPALGVCSRRGSCVMSVRHKDRSVAPFIYRHSSICLGSRSTVEHTHRSVAGQVGPEPRHLSNSCQVPPGACCPGTRRCPLKQGDVFVWALKGCCFRVPVFGGTSHREWDGPSAAVRGNVGWRGVWGGIVGGPAGCLAVQLFTQDIQLPEAFTTLQGQFSKRTCPFLLLTFLLPSTPGAVTLTAALRGCRVPAQLGGVPGAAQPGTLVRQCLPPCPCMC